ncbi:hypothetical protein ACSBR2_008889 [Camellia fascicularis]
MIQGSIFIPTDWYFDEAWKNNPCSRFELDFENNKHFKRVFVAFHVCIAGFNYYRSGKNLNSFVESFFHADIYCQAYSLSIGPAPIVEKPVYSIDDTMILPPLSKRPTGRLKKNRIASTGEFKRVMKCSRCGSIGHHNKRTCKESLLNSCG